MTNAPDLVAASESEAGMAHLARLQDGLLRHLAGPVYPMATTIFVGQFAPVYPLSHPHRRQLWNAVLAVTGPNANPEPTRSSLLKDGARGLLKYAYTTVPRGFVTVLGRLGDIGLAPETYRFWHAYLSEYPDDARIIRSMRSISMAMTDAMRQLPRPLARLLLKRQGADPKPFLRLAELMTWVHLKRPDPSIWDDLAARLEQREAPKKIVEIIADALPCPRITSTAIPGSDTFRPSVSFATRVKTTATASPSGSRWRGRSPVATSIMSTRMRRRSSSWQSRLIRRSGTA